MRDVTDSAQCEECQTIREELGAALAEMSPESAEQFWSDRSAFMKLIGGTEEDLEHIEDSSREYRFRVQFPVSLEAIEGRNPKIQSALRKMLVHRFRTGHGLSLYR